jgi:hypothetical protein
MCCRKKGLLTPRGFIDVDYANDLKEHKSTLGYLFSLGSGLVSWCSVKQNVVVQFSFEAKYHVLPKGTKEVLWIKQLL